MNTSPMFYVFEKVGIELQNYGRKSEGAEKRLFGLLLCCFAVA
jgi:hypothetical protein